MGTGDSGRTQWPLITAGVIVSLLGFALLIERIEHRSTMHLGQLWPLFLIAAAAGVTGSQRGHGDLRKGLILLAVGVWFLANTLEIGGLDYGTSWPLLLILMGVAMTVTPGAGRRACCSTEGPLMILWGMLGWIAVHHVWGLSWSTVWPLAIVAIGVAMVWRAVAEQFGRAPQKEGERSDDD